MCDKKFSSKYHIKKHYTTFHPKKPFSFNIHLPFASKQGKCGKSGSPLKVGEFGCVVCDKKFSSKDLIKKHYTSFHPKEPFSFKKPFASKQQPEQKGAQQKARQLKKACRKFGSPLKDGEIGCVVCDKKFSSKDYVRDH
mgnify:CR=1 FL=1